MKLYFVANLLQRILKTDVLASVYSQLMCEKLHQDVLLKYIQVYEIIKIKILLKYINMNILFKIYRKQDLDPQQPPKSKVILS